MHIQGVNMETALRHEPAQVPQITQIVGVSREADRIRAFIRRAGATRDSLLVLGETGTGKDQIAEAIHQIGNSETTPFVAVDCGALSKGVTESQLFGHRRGSFTGAHEDSPGVISLAGRGTLFFNEVANMGPDLQAAFLRILDRKSYRAVGGRENLTVDARIIAATNADLNKAVLEGTFRQDLYFRLKGVTFSILPLRERIEDVPVLAEHFLSLGGVKRFSEEAKAAMGAYGWPGNVRELKNVVDGAVFHSGDEEEIGLEHLHFERGQNSGPRANSYKFVAAEEKLHRMISGGESFWNVVYSSFMARDMTREEVRYVLDAGLKETRGNFRSVTKLFNMPLGDYGKFMNFLRKHDCRLDFSRYR